MKNIVLIGFQGVGKTFFGKKLAKRCGMNFIDTDILINQHFGNKKNNREIFLEIGEKAFRKLEKEILEKLCSCGNSIVATGGGVVEIEDVGDILQAIGSVIYLKEELSILQERWDNTPRIYLRGKKVEEVYKRRDLLYSKAANEIVEGKWDQILLADSLQLQLLESPTALG